MQVTIQAATAAVIVMREAEVPHEMPIQSTQEKHTDIDIVDQL